jgi:hypothetical protein
MITENLNIFEYEEVLTGRKKDFLCSFKGSFRENCIEVGNIWRYAILHILKWNAKEAEKYMTDELVDKLMLNKTFSGINFDRGHTYIQDYRFVLQYAFPGEVIFDKRAQAIAEYEHVAKLGVWQGNKEYYKYPKKFFLDNDGIERSKILLRYVINLYLSTMTVEELYAFFNDKTSAARWLQRKKLGVPIKLIFLSPIEYLHYSLPVQRRDDIIYYNYKIANMCRDLDKPKRRPRGSVKAEKEDMIDEDIDNEDIDADIDDDEDDEGEA